MALQLKFLFSRVLNGLVLVRDSMIEARAMQAEAYLKHYRRGMELPVAEPGALQQETRRVVLKDSIVPAE